VRSSRAEEAAGEREREREREREERMLAGRKTGEKLFFGLFWTRFSLPSGHNISLYL